jgi:hypothetical protein
LALAAARALLFSDLRDSRASWIDDSGRSPPFSRSPCSPRCPSMIRAAPAQPHAMQARASIQAAPCTPEDGALFAHYVRRVRPPPRRWRARRRREDHWRGTSSSPLVERTRRAALGTIYLRAQYDVSTRSAYLYGARGACHGLVFVAALLASSWSAARGEPRPWSPWRRCEADRRKRDTRFAPKKAPPTTRSAWSSMRSTGCG